jgi:DNA-binding Xre family transcriptional regulator
VPTPLSTRVLIFVGLKRPVNSATDGFTWRIDLREVFAANLSRLCHAKELSQEDLAYEAGVNRTYMSKIEKGATWVGLEIIGKLAAVLEVEPAELLRLPPRRSRRSRG